jgi:hypothetical protein
MARGFTFLHVAETCIFPTEISYQLYVIFRSYSSIVLFKSVHVFKDSEASEEFSKFEWNNNWSRDLYCCCEHVFWVSNRYLKISLCYYWWHI